MSVHCEGRILSQLIAKSGLDAQRCVLLAVCCFESMCAVLISVCICTFHVIHVCLCSSSGVWVGAEFLCDSCSYSVKCRVQACQY